MTDDLAKDLKASVRDFYERCATSFSHTRSHLVWPEEKIVAAKIKPSMTVADVGAGNGRFAHILPLDEGELEGVRAIRYIGIEPSAALRSRVEMRHASSLPDVRAGELPNLPLENAVADVTICFAVFHHIPGIENRKQAVDELVRITKLGGWIAATSWIPTPSPSNSPSGRGRIRVEGGDPGDMWVPWTSGGESGKRYVHVMDEKEWAQLWTRPDLAIEKIGVFGKDDWTEHPAEARNWFVMARKVL